MDKYQKDRMLLSHNFDIQDNLVPKLSREDFALYLIDKLSTYTDINCSKVNNHHWILEILFDKHQRSPISLGILCLQALAARRKVQKVNHSNQLDILALGGIKTTPVISISSTSLKLGEWGVDIVETNSAEKFLKSIDWEVNSTSKPPDSIFSVELQV